MRQILQSVRNRSFVALLGYGLSVGIAGGLGAALYLYNTSFFFAFSGPQIATTGLGVMLAPALALWAAPYFGRRYGKKKGAIGNILAFLLVFPIPYVLLLMGWWPALGSWLSLIIYSVFVVAQTAFIIVGNILLDSMMADVVEDSQVDTARRSEGLFFAARAFAMKAVSAGGIFGAGIVVFAGRLRWHHRRRAGHERDAAPPRPVLHAAGLRVVFRRPLPAFALSHRSHQPRGQSGRAGAAGGGCRGER